MLGIYASSDLEFCFFYICEQARDSGIRLAGARAGYGFQAMSLGIYASFDLGVGCFYTSLGHGLGLGRSLLDLFELSVSGPPESGLGIRLAIL